MVTRNPDRGAPTAPSCPHCERAKRIERHERLLVQELRDLEDVQRYALTPLDVSLGRRLTKGKREAL